jgi:hypothetical protein
MSKVLFYSANVLERWLLWPACFLCVHELHTAFFSMQDSINFYGIGSSIYAYTDANARSEPFSNGSCFGRSTIVSRLSAGLRTLGGLWGLIVAEKPNLFASHKEVLSLGIPAGTTF